VSAATEKTPGRRPKAAPAPAPAPRHRDRGAYWLPYQQRWIDDQSIIAVMRGSRRIGKDYAEAYRAVKSRLSGVRLLDYNYSSADEQTAQEFLDYCSQFCKQVGFLARQIWDVEIIDEQKIKVGRIELPEVAGRRPVIRALSSHPRSFRGRDGDITLSEWAFHNDPWALWDSASPVTTLGGVIRVLSTVNEEGDAFEQLCAMGVRREGGHAKPGDLPVTLHAVTIHDAVAGGLVEQINQTRKTAYTRDSFLAECRSKCRSQEQWDREYLCKPSAQASSFFPYAMTRPCVDGSAPRPTDDASEFTIDIASRCAVLSPSALYVGVDVARTNDLFVAWVLGRAGTVLHTMGVLVWDTKVLKRLNAEKRTFTEMELVLTKVMDATFRTDAATRGVRVARLCGDRTGIGENLMENLERKFRSRVEGVLFTNASKAEMFPMAREQLVEKTCTLPDDEATLADFSTVKQVVLSGGGVRYDAVRNENGHMDRASAFTLAVRAAANKAGVFVDGWTAGGVRL